MSASKKRKRPQLLLSCFVPLWALLSAYLVGAESLQTSEDIVAITRAAGYAVTSEDRPHSSIVIDGESGDILWGDQIDRECDPASITKVMVAYLVMEAMAKGKFSEQSDVVATETDQAISQIYALSNTRIQVGVAYPVRDLLYQLFISSSAAATLMLARQVEPREGGLIDLMNQKANELGMTHTRYVNAVGIESTAFQGLYQPAGYDPTANNVSTARDTAILAFYIVKKFPQLLTYAEKTEMTTMAGTPYEEQLKGHNASLAGVPVYGLIGVNGLKTGSSPHAGYSYVVTAQRDKEKRIMVVLGVSHWENKDGELIRSAFGNALLEKSFAEYSYKKLYSKGRHIIDGKTIKLQSDVYATTQNTQSPQVNLKGQQLVVNNQLSAVSPAIQTHAVDIRYLTLSEKIEQTFSSFLHHVYRQKGRIGSAVLIVFVLGYIFRYIRRIRK